MNEPQTDQLTSAHFSEVDVKKAIQDLTSAASKLQSLIDHRESVNIESIRFIPSLLEQTREVLLQAETQLQQSESNLKDAQHNILGINEMKTLLDILPIGIIISHDPNNLNITINQAGMKMLNLPPGTNPSKSAPGGEKLPFKVLQGGKEVPTDQLPMQYATRNRVALHDIELDVERSDGKLINLIEYATPLYDDRGAVRGGLGVIVDITAHKSIEKRLVMQYQIARILAESNSINNASTQVLQLICETGGWEYGTLWRVDQGALTITNEGVWNADCINLSKYAEATLYSVLDLDEAGLLDYVYHNGEPLWLENFEGFDFPDLIAAEENGLHSGFILPIRSGSRVIAILECFSNHHKIQDQNLFAMLNAVGNQIGIFLERKLLEEALAVRAAQQQLLAQAGMALSDSIEFEKRLQTIVHVIVPDLADWCAIDIIDQDNILRRAAVSHVDPGKEDLIYKIQPTQKVDLSRENQPDINTLLTGKSLIYREIPFELVEKTVVDPTHLEIYRQLNPISSIIVPLIAHNRILGLCTLVQSDSGRRYTSSDLILAEDIGQRLALALDNSILYAQSQQLNVELEHRVDERTTQLKFAVDQLTNQITERMHAEEKIRILNTELELRIEERTYQLELANSELQKEIQDRRIASLSLKNSLGRTKELYRISQMIGIARTPDELLNVLLSSSYLKDASRASIAILDKPWIPKESPPEHCQIVAEWNRGKKQPRFFNHRFTLEEYGIVKSIPFSKPIVIQDIQSVKKLPERVRRRFADLQTHSLIILPLIAGGEWYGLLSLHFMTPRMTKMDDLQHVRGLVDEVAIAIKNIRSLEAESQARHEAEAANDLKLKFLAMISHELRTPMTSIKGFATTLLADDVVWPKDKQLDFLRTISREADKLEDLIEQILDLSRMEAGMLRISSRKLSLKNVMDAVQSELQILAINHELVFDIQQNLPAILGDGQRVAQVLTNLVGNATKFSPQKSQIKILAFQSGEMIQVEVSDQGSGIPLPERTRVFEAFSQLENGTRNRSNGAGLGLAICKGIIEAQGGRIWIKDQPGPGTVISFTLPIWKIDDASK